ncbi:TM2 domain-containing protein [Alloiococcus sp. CFN-8]|uniref:TM2 domain-containing protein n=1 Tax=Alloiococcus sp. CFN-8 TaxID=3416081 RepID=UPI003CFB693E
MDNKTSNENHISKKKSRIIAGLLGVFLGFLGVHRFYLGYKEIGTLQIVVTILTCFVGGVWGVLEGVLIFLKIMDTDALGNQLI